MRCCFADEGGGLSLATFSLKAGFYNWQVSRMPEGIMAKIIEFYIPKEFRKSAKWVPVEQCGQVIEFTLPPKKSA